MPKVELTDQFVEKVEHDKSYTVDYYDKETGLILRVTPAGTKTFTYRYRWNNETQRIKIGRYPMYSAWDAKMDLRKIKGDLSVHRNPKARMVFATINNIEHGTTYEEVLDKDLLKISELIEKF